MPLLSVATKEYVNHCIARKHPKGTWGNRRGTLWALKKVTGDIDTARLSPSHVDELFTANAHWSYGTANNHLSNLNLFFKWCRFRKFMPRDSDPTFGWSFWKYEPQEKMRIPAGEWSRLFSACESPLETITIATGLYLFLRGSEQKCIQLKHIHLDNDTIEIYRVKKKAWATLPISGELKPYLLDYLTWLASQGHTNPEHYLICSRYPSVQGPDGKFYAAGAVNPNKPVVQPAVEVQRVLARAGYPTYWEGEHTLRRSGARAYFDSLVELGYDGALRRVQWFLGHSSSVQTERYVGLSLERYLVQKEVGGKPMFPALQDVRVVPLRQGL